MQKAKNTDILGFLNVRRSITHIVMVDFQVLWGHVQQSRFSHRLNLDENQLKICKRMWKNPCKFPYILFVWINWPRNPSYLVEKALFFSFGITPSSRNRSITYAHFAAWTFWADTMENFLTFINLNFSPVEVFSSVSASEPRKAIFKSHHFWQLDPEPVFHPTQPLLHNNAKPTIKAVFWPTSCLSALIL